MDNWNQNRSNFRTGEPRDHEEAKAKIMSYLTGAGFVTKPEYPLVPGFVHDYDVVGFGKMVIVEVDDPNLHAKPKHVINDGVARDKAETYFPQSRFIRLNKDEINAETGEYYIADKLAWI